MDEVSCSGSENSLDECSHDGWSYHNCDHDEDVAIECDPPTTPAATNGIYASLFRQKRGQETKKTKREKYTARQSNTIPAATWTYI